MSNNIEEVAAIYVMIRDLRDEATREYEAKKAEFDTDLDQLEKAMLSICNDLGNISSIKTNSGTVIRSLKERFGCGDWDGFRKFELANPDHDFRERRIHQGNMKQYLATIDPVEQGMPPGVNVFREYTITVRRPSEKPDKGEEKSE